MSSLFLAAYLAYPNENEDKLQSFAMDSLGGKGKLLVRRAAIKLASKMIYYIVFVCQSVIVNLSSSGLVQPN